MTNFWEQDTPVEESFWAADEPVQGDFWSGDEPVSSGMDMTVSEGLDKLGTTIEDNLSPEAQVATGLGENIAAMGTEFGSMLFSGPAGLGSYVGSKLGGADDEKARQNMVRTEEEVREDLTYKPRTRMGQLQQEELGDLFGTVVEKAGEAGEYIAPEGYEMEGRHLAETGLEATLALAPFAKPIGKGIKNTVTAADDVLRNKRMSQEIIDSNLAVDAAKQQGYTVGKPSGRPDPFMAAEIKPMSAAEVTAAPVAASIATPKVNEKLDGANKSNTVAEGTIPKTSGGIKVFDTIDHYRKKTELDPKNPLLSKVFGGVIDTPYLRIQQQFPNSTLGLSLRKVDADVGFKKTEYDHIVNKFDDLERAFTKAERDTYKKHWLRQEMAEVRKMTEEKLGTTEARNLWAQYDEAMRIRFEELKQTGLKIEAIPDYLPRFVSDMDKFNKLVPGTHQQKFFRLQENYKNGNITSAEYSNQLNRLLTGGADPFVSPASTRHAKARTAEQAQHFDAYSNPAETLRTYFNETGTTIAERRFLGKGDTTADAIARVVEKEVDSGKITLEQAEQLRNVLTARFGPQVHHAPNAAVGMIKDVGYMTTIGQVGSAVLQFADMIAAFAKYPSTALPAAMKSALPKSLRKKMDTIDPLDVGLGDIMQELAGKPSKSMWLLDKTLRATGFKMVDRFGKRVIINAARNRYKKLAKTKQGQQKLANMGYKNLMEKAGKGEWDRFVKDLAEGNMKNDNVRFAVVNAVAEVQPIFLADMPMMYLKHPNGRIAYSLKTWALRFINRLREDIMQGGRSIKAGNIKEGVLDHYGRAITYAGAMYLATNSIDFAKMGLHSLWHGDDIRPENMSNKALDNFLMMFTMTNRYDWSMGYGKEPTDLAISKVTPPAAGLFNAIFKDIALWDDWEIEKSKVVQYTPIAGRVIKDAAKEPKKQDYFWEE